MKTYNVFTIIGLAIAGLSITEQVTFILGVLALITAIIVNIIGMQSKRAEKKKHQLESKLLQKQLNENTDER